MFYLVTANSAKSINSNGTFYVDLARYHQLSFYAILAMPPSPACPPMRTLRGQSQAAGVRLLSFFRLLTLFHTFRRVFDSFIQMNQVEPITGL